MEFSRGNELHQVKAPPSLPDISTMSMTTRIGESSFTRCLLPFNCYGESFPNSAGNHPISSNPSLRLDDYVSILGPIRFDYPISWWKWYHLI
jgi:hypothetical protein